MPFVQLLVENSAEIKPRDTFGNGDNTAIDTAITEGFSQIAEYLLSKGAKSCGSVSKDTYIGYAAAKNDIGTVEALAKYGALEHLQLTFHLADEKYQKGMRRCKNLLDYDYSDAKRAELTKQVTSANNDYMKDYYQKQLSEFDTNKTKILAKYEELTTAYQRIISVLMDYAVGLDLSPNKNGSYGLTFLTGMDISGLNFVGVSVGGQPVTREMLKEAKLEGYENAIVTVTDIEKIADDNRKAKLKERLDSQIEIKGKLINNDIINLIPLWRAAQRGDVEAVKARLAAGSDPNETHDEDSSHGTKPTHAIVFAIRNGYVDIVKMLLESSAFDYKTLPEAISAADQAKIEEIKSLLDDSQQDDVNKVDAENNTLLHRAVDKGDVSKVKRLIARGANVNLKGGLGYPLNIAAQYCYRNKSDSFYPRLSKPHSEILRILLANQADPNVLDNDKNTVLHYAVNIGDVEVVKRLIAMGADVNLKGSLGYPLHIASKKSYKNNRGPYSEPSKVHIEMIRMLLANKADPNLLEDYTHCNALRIAAAAGSAEAVEMLLPITEKCSYKTIVYGLDIKEKTVPWFLDMMFSSCSSGEWIPILKLLKANGADLSLLNADENNTLLHLVMSDFPSFSSVYSAMCQLRQSFAGCEDRYPPTSTLNKSFRQLIESSKQSFMQHIKLLDFFLENGVNVALKTRNGNNALHEFMENANLEHVVGGYARVLDKFLYQKGFDINATNATGRTLLHIAASRGLSSAVQYLITHGANLNAQDTYGNTALHYAVGYGFPAHASPLTTACLVKAGAKTDMTNNAGLNALAYSQSIINEFREYKTFKGWSQETQLDTLDEFKEAQQNLSLSVENHKKNDFDGELMKNFIENCRKNNVHRYDFKDVSTEDQLLLDMYRDDMTHQLMQVPVVWNERLYDLDTLLDLHKAGQPDPFTHQAIDLSTIEPAENIADELEGLIQRLQNDYSLQPIETTPVITATNSDKPKEVTDVLSKVTSPGTNGMFGKLIPEKITIKPENAPESKSNDCII